MLFREELKVNFVQWGRIFDIGYTKMKCNLEWHRIKQRGPAWQTQKPFWGSQTIGTVLWKRVTLGLYIGIEKFAPRVLTLSHSRQRNQEFIKIDISNCDLRVYSECYNKLSPDLTAVVKGYSSPGSQLGVVL
jgi:hypothetical protein